MKEALGKTLARLLKPLVRMVLRYGYTFADFAEVARSVFVEVADDDFALTRSKQTTARIAMLTGTQRKVVS